MKFGLSPRLLLVISLVLLSTVSTLGYVLILQARQTTVENKIYRARLLAKALANSSTDALVAKDYELLQRLIQASTAFEDFAYALIARPDHTIIGHTDQGLVARKIQAAEQAMYKGNAVRVVRQPIRIGNKTLAELHLAFYRDSDRLYADGTVIRTGLILIVAAIMMVLLTVLILRWFLGPLEKLAKAIASTPRDYSLRMEKKLLQRGDEVGLVARNFNNLLKRLSLSFSELSAEKERAQTTLNSIADAVITTDAKGLITYMNKVAQELTGWPLNEALGRELDEVLFLHYEHSNLATTSVAGQCMVHGGIIRSIRNKMLYSRTGKKYQIQESAAALKDANQKVTGAVLVLNDVTELRRLATELNFQLMHDALTGLINRYEFERQLQTAIEQARLDSSVHTVAFLDIDQFKVINDTLGHVAGDELIKKVATHLSEFEFTHPNSTPSRLGGDAFALLTKNSTVNETLELMQNLLNQLRADLFHWDGRTFEVNASVGLVRVDKHSINTVQVLADADVACHTAKEQGRNRIYIFGDSRETGSPYHSDLIQATKLKDALAQNRLCLFAQPIADLCGGDEQPIHFEVLLRIFDDNGEVTSPGPLIPCAERFGFMAAVDSWVIETVCSRYDYLFNDNDIVASINLSGNSLSDPGFLEFVEQCISDNNIPPQCLCFEITETAAIRQLHPVSGFMRRMGKLGVKFSLDDFGSGLSSLMYLKELPVDYLKIDGSFVREMIHNKMDRAMVAAISQMAQTMGIETIAEFVCNRELIPYLRSFHVNYAQGYAISPPLPIEAMAATNHVKIALDPVTGRLEP